MKLVIIHDSEKLYFEALREMEKKNKLETQVFYVHFVQRFIKGCLALDLRMVKIAAKSALFFLSGFFISGRTVLAGIAPYDPALLGWMGLAKRNRVIYHTSWPYWQGDNQPVNPGLFAGIVKVAWRRFIKNENVFIACVLEKTRNEIIKVFGKNAAKISVIPHAVNTRVFRPRPSKRGALNVLFAGRLVREKGLLDLAEIIKAADAKKYFFGIVGRGRDEALLSEVKGLNNVRFYGRVNDRQKMAEITASHDVMLLPSYKTKTWEELFGIAVLEAWASGLAVIATDCVGPKHLINHMKNGILVKQRDVKAMSSMLQFLHKNRQALKRISKAAVKSAGNYNMDKTMRLWEIFLEKVVKGGVE